MPEETFVTRAEFGAVKELNTERHGTLLIRLDSLEARMVAQKEVQDLVNKDLQKEVGSMASRLVLQTIVLAILVAVNLPGLYVVLKGGAVH